MAAATDMYQHQLADAAGAFVLEGERDGFHAGLAVGATVARLDVHVFRPQAHIAVVAVGGADVRVDGHPLAAVAAAEAKLLLFALFALLMFVGIVVIMVVEMTMFGIAFQFVSSKIRKTSL